IKETIRGLVDRRNELQKDVGRLEVQMEMAQKSTASVNPDAEKFRDLLKKIHTELELSLNEDPRELHALVESLLEEIDFVLQDEAREEKRAPVPDTLKKEFAGITSDLKALEKELLSLREQEKTLEESQEGFYKIFKSAVAEVQTAKNKIGEWENKNREHVLEKERLDLRREEV